MSNVGDLERLYAQIRDEKGRLDILFVNAGIARELAHMGVVDWPMTEKEVLGLLESVY